MSKRDMMLSIGTGTASFPSSGSCSQCYSAESPILLSLASLSEEALLVEDDEDFTAEQQQQQLKQVPAVADRPLVRHDSGLERRIQQSIR